ncbi:hypothetical protein ANN_12920 [Periplaneta americana]|uniref:Uncharacterized protein n=1 Tax=Periplaneta americana TaxID=6978 RepID=A0ABQ8TJA5_PERAM|nr:hypothetical protein ANN_12920 [Periplaneta americana]
MAGLCEGGNETPGSLKAICKQIRAEMVRSEVKKKNDEFITEKAEVDVFGSATAKEKTTKDLVNKMKCELEECNRKLDKTIESTLTRFPNILMTHLKYSVFVARPDRSAAALDWVKIGASAANT